MSSALGVLMALRLLLSTLLFCKEKWNGISTIQRVEWRHLDNYCQPSESNNWSCNDSIKLERPHHPTQLQTLFSISLPHLWSDMAQGSSPDRLSILVVWPSRLMRLQNY